MTRIHSGDAYRFQVALTSDASCLAVSARRNDTDGKEKDTRHMRVFMIVQTKLRIQTGGDRGEEGKYGLYYIGDNSGHSLALSDADGYYNREVRLSGFNIVSSEARWDQVLQNIAGETSIEEACRGVAMGKDGMRIVIGSPLYGREGNGHYRGVVKVYEENVYTAPSLSPYK